jgi:hypothetical protein
MIITKILKYLLWYILKVFFVCEFGDYQMYVDFCEFNVAIEFFFLDELQLVYSQIEGY